MKAKQLYLVLSVSLVLMFGSFLGVAYGANKLMSSRATKLAKLRGDSAALDALQTSLIKNKQDVAKYSDLNTIAETIVPQDKDQAEAVREIVNLASQSGIPKLSSITFPTSSLGTIAPTVKANPNLTQLTPVKGMAGVYQLQLTITVASADEVTYGQFLAFLDKLEQNRRTAQVSGITVSPDPKSPAKVAFTLVINEFIKP